MHDLDAAIILLSDLIRVPSYSKEEAGTLRCLKAFMDSRHIPFNTVKNNIFTVNKHFKPGLPTLLLNSHHDTVRPNAGYTHDPFKPMQAEGKLYGLGSNDAGGALVSLIFTFCHYYDLEDLPFNIVLAASAEEEISGANGIELLLQHLPEIHFGIVGEPTSGEVAIAEKGLLVLDCLSHGVSGHAARNEGENAIYNAMADIEWIKNYTFRKESETLGPIHMNVTIIEAGKQHNVVPDSCKFTVDVRTTDAYTLEETLEIIQKNITSEVTPRSVRLRPSSIPTDHPLVNAARECGFTLFGSPTLSDQALMPFPTIKLGPGDSSRSHTADEFIYIDQLGKGLDDYRKLLDKLIQTINE